MTGINIGGRAAPLTVYVPFMGSGGGNDYVGVLTVSPGQDPTQLSASTAQAVTRPTKSPDGTQIAWRQGGSLRTINVDGSNETVIWNSSTSGIVLDAFDWSTDGTKFVFTSGTAGSTEDLMEIASDGSSGDTPTILHSDGSARAVSNPAFNFDGTKISFEVLVSASVIGVWTCDADGTGAAQIGTTPTQLSIIRIPPPRTAWMNLESRLAWDDGSFATPDWKMMDDDGSNIVAFDNTPVPSGRPLWKRWLPDDSAILSLVDTRTDLESRPADGSATTSLFTGATTFTNVVFVFGTRAYMETSAGNIWSCLLDGSDLREETGGTADTCYLVSP